MNKNDKLAAEITAEIFKSRLAAVMVAHGSFKVDKRVARAYNATPEELGHVADLLNRVNQSPFLKGELISVRATLAGRATISADGTIIGKVIAQAMNNVVVDSIARIKAGLRPVGLYKMVVAKGGATVSTIDFNLARATVGALGLKVGKDERNALGYDACITRQVTVNHDRLVAEGKFVEEIAPVLADKPTTDKDEVETATDKDEPTSEELEANADSELEVATA